MKMTEFCDHLYDESTDGYIQILKINDENNNIDDAEIDKLDYRIDYIRKHINTNY